MSNKNILKEEQIQVPVPSESTQLKVLSSTDSLIADLIKEQPTVDQLATLTVKDRKIIDPLELPEECLEKHNKEYVYVWLSKDKDLAIKLRTDGWVLCNRTNSPYIKGHRFGGHGAVEQAGMLLAFLPKRLADEMYERPAALSRAKVKHYTEGIFQNIDPDAKAHLYKPKDTTSKDANDPDE